MFKSFECLMILHLLCTMSLNVLSKFVYQKFSICTGPFCLHNSKLSRCIKKSTICICENKDADQLYSNCTADQPLCFRYSDRTGLLRHIQSLKRLAFFCDSTDRFVLDLVGTPDLWFYHAIAQLIGTFS